MAIVEAGLQDAFSKIREEFDEHLDTINTNTNEIQANYEYICEIDNKIEKLSERMEELSMLMKQQMGVTVEKVPEYNVSPLTKKEQEIFLGLYTTEDEKGSVTYADISRRLGLPETLVQAYITNLVEKGVPIVKRYINNVPFLRLDSKFKQLQAKQNILQLNEVVCESLRA